MQSLPSLHSACCHLSGAAPLLRCRHHDRCTNHNNHPHPCSHNSPQPLYIAPVDRCASDSHHKQTADNEQRAVSHEKDLKGFGFGFDSIALAVPCCAEPCCASRAALPQPRAANTAGTGSSAAHCSSAAASSTSMVQAGPWPRLATSLGLSHAPAGSVAPSRHSGTTKWSSCNLQSAI